MTRMLSINYALTPETKTVLSTIETGRQRILLTVLPPPVLRSLQWNVMVDRAKAIAATFDTPLTELSVKDLLTTRRSPPEGTPQQLLLNYSRTLLYLHEEWTASLKPVTIQSLAGLAEILAFRMKRKTTYRTIPFDDIRHLLEYIAVRDDHPVITAGILYSQIFLLTGAKEFHLFALAAAYLILYKHGYDCRRLLSLEKYFQTDRRSIDHALLTARNTGSLNEWLFIFSDILARETGALVTTVTQAKIAPHGQDAGFHLSERDINILTLFNNPTLTITNRIVQNHCNISQITASRDLAHLTAIGLLAQHGQGRSIYYTKI